ncbi:MAG: 8-oxoguanine deaminase [Phycisphaerales bacterium]|nr:8-oxoguanine deaminase [Phycisphaerales bacterium]
MPTCIHNTTVITCRDDAPVVLDDHSIVFDGPAITHVGPSSEIETALRNVPNVERIDGRNHLVMPGMVNTHHHLYQTLTRGLACVQDAELFDWLTALYTRWRHIDHHAVKLAAQVSIAELLLSGCTTTSDHFYIFPQGTDARIESVLEAADALGMRIHACRGSMSVGESGGGLPPDDCVQEEGDILRDCERAIDTWHDADPLAMRRIDLAPCSPFSISPELLRETATFARERGVLLHTHAAETKDEEVYCLEKFGMRPIPYLQACGWLGSDVYLAHCVHLDDADLAALVETQTGVAHCPCSNMRLGSGTPRVVEMLRRGGKVGLGVDGSSSNDGGNMLGEARQALLLQRVEGGASAMAVADAFRIATVGGARVLNRDRLGKVATGFAADLVMYARDTIELAGAIAQDPLGALMLCNVGRPDRVIVNGRTVVQNARLVNVDERKLAADLNQLVAERFR